jgi:competence protein ComEC
MSRFRAYQMDTIGSSFSYWDGKTFTLLEARFNPSNARSILAELRACNKQQVDVLHITSWDDDHCKPNEIQSLLSILKPKHFELPRYAPKTSSALQAAQEIGDYIDRNQQHISAATYAIADEQFIATLSLAKEWDRANIFFDHENEDPLNSNNNSTVKLFRSGQFSVLSVGDIEAPETAQWLAGLSIVKQEVDVLILAHHGADNGFTTEDFISKVKPHIAVCSSNYDNQFDHPKPEIRTLLNNAGIPLMTTKTGDVVVEATNLLTGQFSGFNLGADSTKVMSITPFTPKKLRKAQQDHARPSALENYNLGKSPASKFLLG